MNSPAAKLREAWLRHISIADYERHMKAAGQTQANASLLEELFLDRAPRLGARVLFAGAGTGQYLDYLPANLLSRYRVTFTDINPGYLSRLSERAMSADFTTVVDDIEQSQLAGPFDLAVVLLVLEHVEWRKAIESLSALAARVFVVIQQDPEEAPPCRLEGTMVTLRECPAVLVDRDALVDAMGTRGYRLRFESRREVLDGKVMLALDFVQ